MMRWLSILSVLLHQVYLNQGDPLQPFLRNLSNNPEAATVSRDPQNSGSLRLQGSSPQFSWLQDQKEPRRLKRQLGGQLPQMATWPLYLREKRCRGRNRNLQMSGNSFKDRLRIKPEKFTPNNEVELVGGNGLKGKMARSEFEKMVMVEQSPEVEDYEDYDIPYKYQLLQDSNEAVEETDPGLMQLDPTNQRTAYPLNTPTLQATGNKVTEYIVNLQRQRQQARSALQSRVNNYYNQQTANLQKLFDLAGSKEYQGHVSTLVTSLQSPYHGKLDKNNNSPTDFSPNLKIKPQQNWGLKLNQEGIQGTLGPLAYYPQQAEGTQAGFNNYNDISTLQENDFTKQQQLQSVKNMNGNIRTPQELSMGIVPINDNSIGSLRGEPLLIPINPQEQIIWENKPEGNIENEAISYLSVQEPKPYKVPIEKVWLPNSEVSVINPHQIQGGQTVLNSGAIHEVSGKGNNQQQLQATNNLFSGGQDYFKTLEEIQWAPINTGVIQEGRDKPLSMSIDFNMQEQINSGKKLQQDSAVNHNGHMHANNLYFHEPLKEAWSPVATEAIGYYPLQNQEVKTGVVNDMGIPNLNEMGNNQLELKVKNSFNEYGQAFSQSQERSQWTPISFGNPRFIQETKPLLNPTDFNAPAQANIGNKPEENFAVPYSSKRESALQDSVNTHNAQQEAVTSEVVAYHPQPSQKAHTTLNNNGNILQKSGKEKSHQQLLIKNNLHQHEEDPSFSKAGEIQIADINPGFIKERKGTPFLSPIEPNEHILGTKEYMDGNAMYITNPIDGTITYPDLQESASYGNQIKNMINLENTSPLQFEHQNMASIGASTINRNQQNQNLRHNTGVPTDSFLNQNQMMLEMESPASLPVAPTIYSDEIRNKPNKQWPITMENINDNFISASNPIDGSVPHFSLQDSDANGIQTTGTFNLENADPGYLIKKNNNKLSPTYPHNPVLKTDDSLEGNKMIKMEPPPPHGGSATFIVENRNEPNQMRRTNENVNGNPISDGYYVPSLIQQDSAERGIMNRLNLESYDPVQSTHKNDAINRNNPKLILQQNTDLPAYSSLNENLNQLKMYPSDSLPTGPALHPVEDHPREQYHMLLDTPLTTANEATFTIKHPDGSAALKSHGTSSSPDSQSQQQVQTEVLSQNRGNAVSMTNKDIHETLEKLKQVGRISNAPKKKLSGERSMTLERNEKNTPEVPNANHQFPVYESNPPVSLSQVLETTQLGRKPPVIQKNDTSQTLQSIAYLLKPDLQSQVEEIVRSSQNQIKTKPETDESYIMAIPRKQLPNSRQAAGRIQEDAKIVKETFSNGPSTPTAPTENIDYVPLTPSVKSLEESVKTFAQPQELDSKIFPQDEFYLTNQENANIMLVEVSTTPIPRMKTPHNVLIKQLWGDTYLEQPVMDPQESNAEIFPPVKVYLNENSPAEPMNTHPETLHQLHGQQKKNLNAGKPEGYVAKSSKEGLLNNFPVADMSLDNSPIVDVMNAIPPAYKQDHQQVVDEKISVTDGRNEPINKHSHAPALLEIPTESLVNAVSQGQPTAWNAESIAGSLNENVDDTFSGKMFLKKPGPDVLNPGFHQREPIVQLNSFSERPNINQKELPSLNKKEQQIIFNNEQILEPDFDVINQKTHKTVTSDSLSVKDPIKSTNGNHFIQMAIPTSDEQHSEHIEKNNHNSGAQQGREQVISNHYPVAEVMEPMSSISEDKMLKSVPGGLLSSEGTVKTGNHFAKKITNEDYQDSEKMETNNQPAYSLQRKEQIISNNSPVEEIVESNPDNSFHEIYKNVPSDFLSRHQQGTEHVDKNNQPSVSKQKNELGVTYATKALLPHSDDNELKIDKSIPDDLLLAQGKIINPNSVISEQAVLKNIPIDLLPLEGTVASTTENHLTDRKTPFIDQQKVKEISSGNKNMEKEGDILNGAIFQKSFDKPHQSKPIPIGTAFLSPLNQQQMEKTASNNNNYLDIGMGLDNNADFIAQGYQIIPQEKVLEGMAVQPSEINIGPFKQEVQELREHRTSVKSTKESATGTGQHVQKIIKAVPNLLRKETAGEAGKTIQTEKFPLDANPIFTDVNHKPFSSLNQNDGNKQFEDKQGYLREVKYETRPIVTNIRTFNLPGDSELVDSVLEETLENDRTETSERKNENVMRIPDISGKTNENVMRTSKISQASKISQQGVVPLTESVINDSDIGDTAIEFLPEPHQQIQEIVPTAKGKLLVKPEKIQRILSFEQTANRIHDNSNQASGSSKLVVDGSFDNFKKKSEKPLPEALGKLRATERNIIKTRQRNLAQLSQLPKEENINYPVHIMAPIKPVEIQTLERYTQQSADPIEKGQLVNSNVKNLIETTSRSFDHNGTITSPENIVYDQNKQMVVQTAAVPQKVEVLEEAKVPLELNKYATIKETPVPQGIQQSLPSEKSELQQQYQNPDYIMPDEEEINDERYLNLAKSAEEIPKWPVYYEDNPESESESYEEVEEPEDDNVFRWVSPELKLKRKSGGETSDKNDSIKSLFTENLKSARQRFFGITPVAPMAATNYKIDEFEEETPKPKISVTTPRSRGYTVTTETNNDMLPESDEKLDTLEIPTTTKKPAVSEDDILENSQRNHPANLNLSEKLKSFESRAKAFIKNRKQTMDKIKEDLTKELKLVTTLKNKKAETGDIDKKTTKVDNLKSEKQSESSTGSSVLKKKPNTISEVTVPPILVKLKERMNSTKQLLENKPTIKPNTKNNDSKKENNRSGEEKSECSCRTKSDLLGGALKEQRCSCQKIKDGTDKSNKEKCSCDSENYSEEDDDRVGSRHKTRGSEKERKSIPLAQSLDQIKARKLGTCPCGHDQELGCSNSDQFVGALPDKTDELTKYHILSNFLLWLKEDANKEN